MRQLVLVGAGHAHARVLLELSKRRLDDVKIILVAPHALAPYSGMVPGWLAGHYSWDECCIDFMHLCRCAGAEMVLDAVVGIDVAQSKLMLAGGRQLDFKWLSLNHGSTLLPPESTKLQILPMRPLAELQRRWDNLLETVRCLPHGANFRVLMVGGGAAGVESLLAARHRMSSFAPHVRFDFLLATQGKELVPGQSRTAARLLRDHLEKHRITIFTSFSADKFENGSITSTEGQVLEAETVLWATGAQAHLWARTSGLAVDTQGFIRIRPTLQTISNPDVFAAGDCASWEKPLPKAGVFAVRMGPVLARNIIARINGNRLESFSPQRRYLTLIGTGERHAVASWNGIGWQGNWVWRWKEHIDRQFIAKYNTLVRNHGLVRLNE